MSEPTPTWLVDYLVERDQERADRAAGVLEGMTERERALFREAAVMGYVQGAMAGTASVRLHKRDPEIPKTNVVTRLVIDGCLGFGDLYPTVASLDAGQSVPR